MRSLVSLALAGALALSALVPSALTPKVQAAEQTPEQILAKMNLDQKVGQLLWTHVTVTAQMTLLTLVTTKPFLALAYPPRPRRLRNTT